MKNNTIKRNIINYLKSNDVFILPKDTKFKNGILGIINGGVLLVIIINKKKKTTIFQKDIINNITKKGGICFAAHSYEEVELQLEDYFL